MMKVVGINEQCWIFSQKEFMVEECVRDEILIFLYVHMCVRVYALLFSCECLIMCVCV